MTLGFIIVSIFSVGPIVLEGLDFGVGVLHTIVGRDDERGAALDTIGPFWDGNEVWLIVTGVQPSSEPTTVTTPYHSARRGPCRVTQ